MNYIDQINWFWQLGGAHFSNGNETRLYFFLLKQSNSLYWKNPLANADGYIAAMVGISVNTLKTCRNRLQQAGLITFKTGGSGPRDKCRYTIVDARVQRDDGRYQKLTPFPEPNAQPNQQPYPQKTDDNYKHKQEEKENKNKTSGGGIAATPPRWEVFSEGMAMLE